MKSERRSSRKGFYLLLLPQTDRPRRLCGSGTTTFILMLHYSLLRFTTMLCTYMYSTDIIREDLICPSVALKSNIKKHFCFLTGDSVTISR